ncbi:hypothetical protein VHP8226_01694 [Vibrio hippocampi]|uniref:Chromosome partitioning protein ParA n=2 Tax=Vibrio hippocampi TaxID=654686 RepID=A0ABM8ZHT0_9VIBR|nr:hypothetical protein VHP8226_01694 [Vibrio hippocampi]
MQFKNKVLTAVIVSIISVPSFAFLGSDITLKKNRSPTQPIPAEGFKRKVYQLNTSEIPKITVHGQEQRALDQLISSIDLQNLDAAAFPTLTYQGAESKALEANFYSIIEEMKVAQQRVLADEQMKIEQAKASDVRLLEQMAAVEASKVGYLADVQVVLDREVEVDRLLVESEKTIETLAAQLADSFNALGSDVVGSKPMTGKKFEKVRMKYKACDEEIEVKGSYIATSQEIRGYCFTSRIPVKRDVSSVVLNNSSLMSHYHDLTGAIYNELILQGEADHRDNLISGYRQEAKSFSRGVTNDAKIQAREKHGFTDKSADIKLKSLSKTHRSNVAKVARMEKDLARVVNQQLLKSPEMEALRPKYEQLKLTSNAYLMSFAKDILGKPVSVDDDASYEIIELDYADSDELTYVIDSYSNQLEVYIVNTEMLEHYSDHRDLKGYDQLPINIAVEVRAVGVVRGELSDDNFRKGVNIGTKVLLAGLADKKYLE